MGKIKGLHHVAIATGNMKEQLQFFSDVLGMRLQGLYWMHGVEGAWHAFMEMGEAHEGWFGLWSQGCFFRIIEADALDLA